MSEKKGDTIVTDIVAKLILPEYFPVTNRSRITKLIPTEFQAGNLWLCFAKHQQGDDDESPINSLGVHLSNYLAPNRRKQFVENFSRSEMLVVTMVMLVAKCSSLWHSFPTTTRQPISKPAASRR